MFVCWEWSSVVIRLWPVSKAARVWFPQRAFDAICCFLWKKTLPHNVSALSKIIKYRHTAYSRRVRYNGLVSLQGSYRLSSTWHLSNRINVHLNAAWWLESIGTYFLCLPSIYEQFWDLWIRHNTILFLYSLSYVIIKNMNTF